MFSVRNAGCDLWKTIVGNSGVFEFCASFEFSFQGLRFDIFSSMLGVAYLTLTVQNALGI